MDRVTSMTAFATVVVAGSFAGAAQRLKMSPAMVTNHVRSLEERLGARLLNRTTRKLSLTEAGRSYYEQCALILAQIEAADTSVSALTSTPRGTLRVNAAPILTLNTAPLIAAYSAAYPEVTLEFTTTDRMVDLVEEGIDMAIRFNQAPDSSLIVRRLGSFRIILCASPTYLAEHGTPREPADLSRHQCVAYMYQGFERLTREWKVTGPKDETLVPITSRIQTNSVETMVAAATEGRGIAMGLSCAVEAAIRAGKLVRVLPEHHLGEYPIIALYPHRQHISAKVRSFLDFAARHFAEMPDCTDAVAAAERAVARFAPAPANAKRSSAAATAVA
ncbi:MAG TPA: LysR family transcriptional regulator [Stellaceae bacterium]|jgi:DNA-binding transcriptional LysR family regulator|nr:LysR family transcriptional regulator [Stellaceae bacterium]